eukprot:GHVT01078308.1.p3 GENE.GHVT01078308.1~~GHVT01078308.1.p3  ORF type:complete len:113 (-),score=6.75 GHVT01078308.1:1144-1482(-)
MPPLKRTEWLLINAETSPSGDRFLGATVEPSKRLGHHAPQPRPAQSPTARTTKPTRHRMNTTGRYALQFNKVLGWKKPIREHAQKEKGHTRGIAQAIADLEKKKELAIQLSY